MTLDSRKVKGGPVDANLTRAARSATTRRPVAKSPSPTEMDQHGEENNAVGLVITNRPDPSPFLDKEEEETAFDDTDADRVLEDLNKEDDDTLSFLIDRRLLHKDFIVDKFSLAQVYFRKVRLACVITADLRLGLFLGWEARIYSAHGVTVEVLQISSDTEGELGSS